MPKAMIPLFPRVRKKKIVQVSEMEKKKQNRLLGALSRASFQDTCNFCVFSVLCSHSVNCRKLTVMQIIPVHGNANEFCPWRCN